MSILWNTPIYKFKIDMDDGSIKEFIINVINSVPKAKNDPGKQLTNIFDKICQSFSDSDKKILDLGAGRLRNSFYFLEKNYQVYITEFNEMYQTESASKILQNAKSYQNFHELILPKSFIIQKKNLILF